LQKCKLAKGTGKVCNYAPRNWIFRSQKVVKTAKGTWKVCNSASKTVICNGPQWVRTRWVYTFAYSPALLCGWVGASGGARRCRGDTHPTSSRLNPPTPPASQPPPATPRPPPTIARRPPPHADPSAPAGAVRATSRKTPARARKRALGRGRPTHPPTTHAHVRPPSRHPCPHSNVEAFSNCRVVQWTTQRPGDSAEPPCPPGIMTASRPAAKAVRILTLPQPRERALHDSWGVGRGLARPSRSSVVHCTGGNRKRYPNNPPYCTRLSRDGSGAGRNVFCPAPVCALRPQVVCLGCV